MPNLHILQIYYEPFPSGQTTHVLSLAGGLIRQGHQVDVVLPHSIESCRPAFEKVGARVFPLGIKKVAWQPSAAAGLLRLTRQHRYAVVHVHSQEAGLVARPLVWLAGARQIVYTPQTIDIRQVRWQRLYIRFEKMLARITSKLISVNEADRLRIVKWGIPASKVVTIPNGIDLALYKDLPDTASLRASLQVPASAPLVMQVGRLSHQKNPLAFVEGAAQVARVIPEAHFVMVGEGPLRAEVEERAAALGLTNNLHLPGRCEAAYRLLAAADMVTLTSLWEGTPYSLLEGMAWSKPAVSTAVNGCVQVVAEGVTGYLTPAGDITAWAGRVADLLVAPMAAMEMGRNARQRVEQCFGLTDMIARIDNLYQNRAFASPGYQDQ